MQLNKAGESASENIDRNFSAEEDSETKASLYKATNTVKLVAANMAIEDMYLDKEFLSKMVAVASGTISSATERKELLAKYDR